MIRLWQRYKKQRRTKMANIEQDLQAIMEARYGRDVRQSIHDAIKDINDQEEGHVSVIAGYTEDAEAWAVGTKNGTPVESTDPAYHNNAKYLAEQASTSATNAGISESNASNSESNAEAWAVGKRAGVDVPSTDPTYENNAKYWQERANYWYQQAQAIAESFSGALRPMGTVTFANLPPLAEATAGDMYNISDEFTTTSDFKEGAGHVIPLGSNIYKTTDSKWDVLAGSPVTGIKGDNEQAYRKGNVNITKGNIGLGNVDNESLGSADISAIGDGSVKGSISSLNTALSRGNTYLVTDKIWTAEYYNENTLNGNTVSMFSGGAMSSTTLNDGDIIGKVPNDIRPIADATLLVLCNSTSTPAVSVICRAIVKTNGEVVFKTGESITAQYILISGTYGIK